MRHRRHDVLDGSFGRDFDRGVGEPKPVGAQPHLRGGFLAGNINGAVTRAGECRRDVKKQGRFADPGIAAKQQDRTADQPAAGNAIELADAGGKPGRFMRGALERLDSEPPALVRRTPAAFGAFLDQRIPLAAGLALAGPAREGGAAILADEALCARRHVTNPDRRADTVG